MTEPFDDRNFDTLMVSGSAVTNRNARSDQIPAPGCGAIPAGSLDMHWRVHPGQSRAARGRRATTHWHRAREFQARFPKVKVEEDRIFIIDGPVWTSAGMTAGIDLALAMIEKDLAQLWLGP